MDEIPLGALIGALFVLLLISGFFSIAETSMMAINRYKLKHLAKQGKHSARLTTQLLAKTDKLLGVILLGSNLINAASAALVTVITVRLLGDSEAALPVATLSVTFFILVFSEITPKVVGAAYPERIALASSYILAPMLRLFHPIVWFINLFVRALLWLLRLKPSTGISPRITMEELRTLVLEAGHYIPPKHQSILINLFELEKTTVDDVMAPRSQIEAIDLAAPLADIKRQLSTSQHSRLPVYEGQLDNIAGILDVRRILPPLQNGELNQDILRQTMREPYFIPAGTPLFSQLQHFQENRRRIGLVVDEYGELKGLICLEDILEEIVGEFAPPLPAQAGFYRRQADGSWLVDGGSTLRDLNRKLGLQLPLDGPRTLNGLILEHLEDIPEAETSLRIAGHTLEIVQTQDRVVKVVRIVAPPAEQPRA